MGGDEINFMKNHIKNWDCRKAKDMWEGKCGRIQNRKPYKQELLDHKDTCHLSDSYNVNATPQDKGNRDLMYPRPDKYVEKLEVERSNEKKESKKKPDARKNGENKAKAKAEEKVCMEATEKVHMEKAQRMIIREAIGVLRHILEETTTAMYEANTFALMIEAR